MGTRQSWSTSLLGLERRKAEVDVTTPFEYEHQVAKYFEALGYATTVTSHSNDYGLDVLAENDHERVAIQAKLYGHTSRQVNRQMMMELHGVSAYFDCDRAVLATDGIVRRDAQEIAQKLNIEILQLTPAASPPEQSARRHDDELIPATPSQPISLMTVERIWTDYVMPLAGRTLHGRSDRTNRVIRVDWSGIERETSNGRRSRIDYEIFRLAIGHILQHGMITRDEINQNYAKRASSGVVLILGEVPLFKLKSTPLRLELDEAALHAASGTVP